MRAFALPESGALVHLHNVSGGVLAGDRLALEVDVEAGAAAQITTTGATRLYRHRAGAADSEQAARFKVGDGAILEYLPDAVIPYARSRHCQRTEIELGRGATVFWWEVLAPGRLAAGEKFAFDRLRVRNEIRAGSRPLLLENYLLEPLRKNLSATARMSAFSHTVSFCAIQEGRADAFWRGLEGSLQDIAHTLSIPGEILWGASTLASDGVIVRGMAMSGRLIHKALLTFWRTARLAISGLDAIPPRKIY